MDGLCWVELTRNCVKADVLRRFDCNHIDFNNFLAEDAFACAENGSGVTYILVSYKEFIENNISVILAFATIQTMALHFAENKKIYTIPAVEIKYFAIVRKYQRSTKYIENEFRPYSTLFFEKLLVFLYSMSIHTVGFRAIFLRANQNGEKLYRRKSFVDTGDFIIPYSEDDPLEQCVPLVLFIQENLHSIFGVE